MKKGNNTALQQNDGGLFPGLQGNSLTPQVHFVVCKLAMVASAFHWRPERRLPSFHSRVVFLSFVIPDLIVSVLFTGPFQLEFKLFFQNMVKMYKRTLK